MTDILPKLAMGFISEQYGVGVTEELDYREESPSKQHSDWIIKRMAKLVTVLTGVSEREFFLALGCQ